MIDWDDYNYRIKGLYEGIWRAAGYQHVRDIRDAADLMWSTLHELADRIEAEK